MEQKRAQQEKIDDPKAQQMENNLIESCFECQSALNDQITSCEKCKKNFCSRCSSNFVSAFFFAKIVNKLYILYL